MTDTPNLLSWEGLAQLRAKLEAVREEVTNRVGRRWDAITAQRVVNAMYFAGEIIAALEAERDALKLWKAERLMWGDAAYARGLEDAAKIAEEHANYWRAKDNSDEYDNPGDIIASAIRNPASSIRALKGERQ